MQIILQIGLLLAVAIGLFLWRREYGLYCVIVAGVLQDVLRKADTGQSIQYLLLSSLICLSMLAVLYLQKKTYHYHLIFQQGRHIYQIFCLYIVFVVFSACWSFYNSSSIFNPALGLFIYLIPVIVVWLIYEMSDSYDFIIKTLKVYVFVQSFVMLTIFLQWQGVLGNDFLYFIEVGDGVEIYDEILENYLQGYNGLYRTPEIAAWHMGFAASITIVLVWISENKRHQAFWVLLAIMFLIAGMLTGRRKMVVVFAIFICQLLWFVFNKNSKSQNANASNNSMLILNFTIATLCLVSIVSIFNLLDNNDFLDYFNRTLSVADVSQSRTTLTFYALKESILESGFLGFGIGTYSPGSRFFQSDLPYQWTAEFGLSQVMLELGLLGAVILLLMYVAMAKLFLRVRSRVYHNDNITKLNGCLFAILVAHVFGFAMASQVYADFYILILLAVVAGFQLSILKLKKSNDTAKRLFMIRLLNKML